MEIIIRKQYLKDLRKVPKHIFTSANTVLDKLRSAENLNKSGVDFTKMQGQKKDKEYYRIRLGDWRMGIELKTPSVIIKPFCIVPKFIKNFLLNNTQKKLLFLKPAFLVLSKLKVIN